MNKYYEMMGHMHMPEEQKEQLKAELMKQSEAKQKTKPIWKRYAAAAALVLCLLGTAATTYAAVRTYWSNVFFTNGNQRADITEDLIGRASTEQVTAQDDNYKFTVLNHLYSKEQQMGLIICSFQFLTEQKTFMGAINANQDGGVTLKKDRIIDDQEFIEANGYILEQEVSFNVQDESATTLLSTRSVYFTGEMAEDGGYLLGIRYSFNLEEKDERIPQASLILENAGDVKGLLKAKLPMSEDVPCVRFVSERKTEDFITVTPLGLSVTMTVDKAECRERALDLEPLKSLKLVTDGENKVIQDRGDEGYMTSSLEDETETTYTWFAQEAFNRLVDISTIDYVEMDGVRYVK